MEVTSEYHENMFSIFKTTIMWSNCFFLSDNVKSIENIKNKQSKYILVKN